MKKFLKVLLILVSAITGVAGILLLMATLAEYKPGNEEKAEAIGTAPAIGEKDSVFTLITWNLGYFGLGKDCDFFYDGGTMTRPSEEQYREYSGKAIEYLKNLSRTDFYFFQEVDINARRSYDDNQVERLRELFQGMESAVALNYVVPFVPMPPNDPMGRVKSGLLCFSAFHSVEYTRYAFPGGYDWPVRLFMLDRCFLLSRLPLPGGKDLVMINTHNEAFDDGSQREQQMAVLKNLMLEEYAKGNFVITGGDWNQNPVGYQSTDIPRIFSAGDQARSIKPAIEPDFFPEGWKWVFDPNNPSNRDVIASYKRGETRTTIIDFFVVSPNVKVKSINTVDLGFAWSDHQPVKMVFRIN